MYTSLVELIVGLERWSEKKGGILYILNLEDNVFKHHDICRVIEMGSFKNVKIDWVRNLTEGLNKIEEMNNNNTPYDVIITDMWYPLNDGGNDNNSGEMLISKSEELGWNIPIILCSTIRYRYSQILGEVYYSKNSNGEWELIDFLRQVK